MGRLQTFEFHNSGLVNTIATKALTAIRTRQTTLTRSPPPAPPAPHGASADHHSAAARPPSRSPPPDAAPPAPPPARSAPGSCSHWFMTSVSGAAARTSGSSTRSPMRIESSTLCLSKPKEPAMPQQPASAGRSQGPSRRAGPPRRSCRRSPSGGSGRAPRPSASGAAAGSGPCWFRYSENTGLPRELARHARHVVRHTR